MCADLRQPPVRPGQCYLSDLAYMGTRGTNDGYMVAIVVTLSTDHRDTAVHWGLLFNQNHEHLGPAVRSSMKVWCSGEEKYVFTSVVSGSYLYVSMLLTGLM